MYNNNVERLIKNLNWEEENATEMLERRMAIIPEDARHIIEVRWGLIGQEKVCPNFVTLNKRLGVENSEELYNKAMKTLCNTEFYEALVDSEDYSFEEAVSLGILASYVFGNPLCKDSISGKMLNEVLCTLTPREETVIRKRFFENMTLEEVGHEYAVSRERIREIESKALKKLRHPSRARKVKVI